MLLKILYVLHIYLQHKAYNEKVICQFPLRFGLDNNHNMTEDNTDLFFY